MERFELIAPCHFGLEAVMKREILDLGYEVSQVEDGRVTFIGDAEAVCRANIFLRTTERILLKVGSFKAETFEELFQGTRVIPWEQYIPRDGKFWVAKASSIKSRLFSPSDIQSIIKKAMVERMKGAYGITWFPEDGASYPLRVFLYKDVVTVAMDTSGDSLHKRGYRTLTSKAPITETLAAALLMLTPWKPDRILVDPFCGSGTFPIEAAMMAANMAPGMNREFLAEEWKNLIPKKCWYEAMDEANDLVKDDISVDIQGYDADGDIVRAARENAARAGVDHMIHFQQRPVAELSHPKKYGFIITNPPYGERIEEKKNLPELYRRYQAALKRAGQMDYDDQMVFALQILRAAPPVLAYFQQRYKYFCVDESQDTSKIQHEIIRLLAGRSLNLFMVGDEDQSIYGFRAAYPQALMDFEQVYPGAQVLLMEENYRSSEEIVAAANAFVARSRYRRPKTLRATQGAQCPIEIRRITRREEQIDWLFEEARRGGGETAVLFRNNESALPLVDLCERRGVPYRFKKADLTFFTHKIVLDAVDFLRFAYEPANGERFLRLYYKFGLALSRQRALAACGASARTGRPILEELIRDSETKTRMRESLGDIYAAFKRIPQLNAADALDAVRHGCGYGAYLNQKGMDTGKLAILEMLAEQEPNALRLLDRLEELRMLIAAKADVNSDVPFVLSTIHSSKGLEYDRVVLLDAFDGVLPAKPEICCRTPEDTRQYEEDRRLFYVAMTRARHKLVLFDCKTMPSVFVQEVIFNLPESRAERELAKAETNRVLGRNKPAAAGPALPPVDVAAVTRVGAAVQHAVFGRGVVTEFDGRFVTVEFSGMRVKKLDAALVAEKHLLWDL